MHAATHSPASQTRWYVVQSKHRQETRAFENLRRQGFCCYLPILRVEKLRRGSKLEVEEPLFPGYLFIRLDQVHDSWHPIRSTRGVRQIVRVNECPLAAKDEVIEGIRQRLAGDSPRVPYLKPGDRVRITEGCFSDVEAIFVANDGDDRVMLLMNILHREQVLSFPVRTVRNAQAARGDACI